MSSGNEAWLLANEASLLRIQCTLAGMTAENIQRQILGHSLAYSEKDFEGLASECEYICNEIQRYG